MTRLLALCASALALSPAPGRAQSAGFGSDARALGVPTGAAKIAAADLTADGTPDVVLLHGQALTLLLDPDLYADAHGDAWSVPLATAAAGIRDFAIAPRVGRLFASGALAVGSAGLDLLWWDPDAGAVIGSSLLGFTDARHVASWAAEGSGFTVCSVVEGDGSLRTAILLDSSGDLFSVSAAVALGSSAIRQVELLDWDAAGSPELAVLRDAVLEIRGIDGSWMGAFAVDGAQAHMAVLSYEPPSPQRLALIDREPKTGRWLLRVLDEQGEEPALVLDGTPVGLATGHHDGDGLPDVLIPFASGAVETFVHAPPGASSFVAASVHTVFTEPPSWPAAPVLAAALSDVDGDGDGDALVADSAATLWLAHGKPTHAGDWMPDVADDLSADEAGVNEVVLQFAITLPDGMPPGSVTAVEVVTWHGSTVTGLVAGSRQEWLEPLLGGVAEPVSVILPIPAPGTELHYVAEVRLVLEGPPRHAYPPRWGDVKVTSTKPSGGGGGAIGGGVLRGTFQPIPPGSAPPPIMN